MVSVVSYPQKGVFFSQPWLPWHLVQQACEQQWLHPIQQAVAVQQSRLGNLGKGLCSEMPLTKVTPRMKSTFCCGSFHFAGLLSLFVVFIMSKCKSRSDYMRNTGHIYMYGFVRKWGSLKFHALSSSIIYHRVPIFSLSKWHFWGGYPIHPQFQTQPLGIRYRSAPQLRALRGPHLPWKSQPSPGSPLVFHGKT